MVKDLGVNIAIGAGGAIHAHPMNPRAGTKAFRQAIDATMKKIPLEQHAEKHPEFKAAVEVWKAHLLSCWNKNDFHFLKICPL